MLGNAKVLSTLPAEDLGRAKNFYMDIVGLPLERSMETEGALIFNAGSGTQIFIYQRERTKAEHTAATFMVEDLDAIVDGLTERGVVFEQYDFGEIKTDARGIAELGDSRGAWFTDTEGNILALVA